MKPRIQCALTPWKPGSTASGPAPGAIYDPAQLQPLRARSTVPPKLRSRSMVGPTPAAMLCRGGHFRLSERSWERRLPVSETGISNTTVASSSGAGAFAGAGAGGFAALAGALAAAFVPLATVASSGVPPSDHGTAGPHGGLPLAGGSAVRSVVRPAAGPAPGAASGVRAASGTLAASGVRAASGTRAAACTASRSRARPRALPRAGAGAGTGSAI